MPYLSIGGTRAEFFKLTPKTIKYDFKAFEKKRERELQMAWLQGGYFKNALESSVIMCGLADKKVINKLPKYPQMPRMSNDVETEKVNKETLIAKMDRYMRRFNSARK